MRNTFTRPRDRNYPHQHYHLTKCDEDGVPRMVQDVRLVFVVRTFDGKEHHFPPEMVAPSIGLMQKTLTPEQWQDAYRMIENYVTANWPLGD